MLLGAEAKVQTFLRAVLDLHVSTSPRHHCSASPLSPLTPSRHDLFMLRCRGGFTEGSLHLAAAPRPGALQSRGPSPVPSPSPLSARQCLGMSPLQMYFWLIQSSKPTHPPFRAAPKTRGTYHPISYTMLPTLFNTLQFYGQNLPYEQTNPCWFRHVDHKQLFAPTHSIAGRRDQIASPSYFPFILSLSFGSLHPHHNIHNPFLPTMFFFPSSLSTCLLNLFIAWLQPPHTLTYSICLFSFVWKGAPPALLYPCGLLFSGGGPSCSALHMRPGLFAPVNKRAVLEGWGGDSRHASSAPALTKTDSQQKAGTPSTRSIASFTSQCKMTRSPVSRGIETGKQPSLRIYLCIFLYWTPSTVCKLCS